MAEATRILVAEDDDATREAWRELIGSWGFRVEAAEDGDRALKLALSYEPHVLVLDLGLPVKDGITVLTEIKDLGLDIATIVVSGQNEIENAVKTIKLGAYDYLCKPIDPAHLRVILGNLCSHLNLNRENERLRRRLIEAGELGPIVGQSAGMRRVMALVEQLAPMSASAIIAGESGTGKELVARAIHELSPRRSGPYVAINCAALPENLMESELFGHERGAFTGADRRRQGCFELAHGGTLLLDEITEMKVELQAKLLRVIEELKCRRLGGTTEVPLDVRVLATSNRELAEAMREGRLREDLYYRLSVFTIEVPPLRERPEDIPLLAMHFLKQFAQANGKAVTGLDPECLETLKSCPWPGNVRQLRNVIERALIVTREAMISTADLPPELNSPGEAGAKLELRLGASLFEIEREVIRRTLESVGGNKAKAAEILGVSVKTLYNRLERYDALDERGKA